MPERSEGNESAALQTFRLSQFRIAFLLVACAAITVLGAAMARQQDMFVVVVGVLLAIGYVGIAAVLCSRLVAFGQQPIVYLSDEGLLDQRLSPQVIPWHHVIEIDVWRSATARGIVLTVDEQYLSEMQLSWSAKAARALTAGLRPTQLPISALDLDTNFKQLFTSVTERWKAYRLNNFE